MRSLLCVRKIAALLPLAAWPEEMTERTDAHHSGNMATTPIARTRVAREFGIFFTGTDHDACCGTNPGGNGGACGEVERAIFQSSLRSVQHYRGDTVHSLSGDFRWLSVQHSVQQRGKYLPSRERNCGCGKFLCGDFQQCRWRGSIWLDGGGPEPKRDAAIQAKRICPGHVRHHDLHIDVRFHQ